MNDEQDDEAKTPVVRFRRATARTRMPPAQARRQGEIATLAFTKLGGRDAALEFLNTGHAVLAGRPIDVATESDEGFDQVKALLADF